METKNILEIVEKSVAVKAKKLDPKKFFKTKKGLWVSDSFQERIIPKAETAAIDMAVASYRLSKYANDAQIEKELPKEHLFSESEVCAVIAALIAKQKKGEEGTLLNTGYWNLFYTPAFVVGVDWGGGVWDVSAWGRVDGAWDDDGRVFSPATDA